MKKNIKHFLCMIASLVLAVTLTGGCHYLDVDPELGVSEEDVFSTYSMANTFLSLAYDAANGNNKYNITLTFPLYMELLQMYFVCWSTTTDAADAGRLGVVQREFKQGYLSQDVLYRYSFGTAQNDKPMCTAMWGIIRMANMLIDRFPLIQNGTEKERADLLGQAYFLRGLAHFHLCRMFGGMPYIDYVLGGDDSFDLPRLSAYETYIKAAEDLEKSYEYFVEAGIMRRNTPDRLVPSNLELAMPSGCTALAVRARALLYAASPLNNQNGEADWVMAADACALALKAALDNQFELLPFENYTDNHTGVVTTNETIWGYTLASSNNVQNWGGMLAYCQSKFSSIRGNSGINPTQNFVDRFETADGYLLRTEADRQKAAAAGSYNEQDPYSNRDPRMDLVIVHDGSPAFDQAFISSEGGVFNIYYDPATGTWPSTTLNSTVMNFGYDWGSIDNATTGGTNTGYYCRRQWNGSFSGSYQHLDPCFRVGEMYLAYAEAVNEAYGPNGTAGGLSITALDALNIVRNRATMPDARSEYVSDKDSFRSYVHNERCVELAFESNHYYWDIRRWKEAPQLMNQTLYGMYIEKTTPSSTYPNGKIYTRRPLPNNRQCVWKDYMYVLPLPDDQANTMQVFVNNQKWQ